MVVGRNNGLAKLRGFLNKRMCGLLFGPHKMVVIKAWSY